MSAPATLVSGSMNFRDVGGLPAGGGVTRSRVLFRSGSLAAVDEEGTAALGRLGLRRIVDLRADEEARRAPSRPAEGATTVRVPLFAGSLDSFFVESLTLGHLYRWILEESADRVVEVVRAVVGDQPVLVHCTAGKDRTGVTVGLILAAAGVDHDAIAADYARTEALLPIERNEAVVAKLRALMPGATTIEELATRSPAPVMRSLLDDLTARYGAPVEFLRAHGLRDDELVELRRVLVAPR